MKASSVVVVPCDNETRRRSLTGSRIERSAQRHSLGRVFATFASLLPSRAP